MADFVMWFRERRGIPTSTTVAVLERSLYFRNCREVWETATKLAVESSATDNSDTPKLLKIIERLEAVETIIGGTSVLSREELDCADEELRYCISQLSV